MARQQETVPSSYPCMAQKDGLRRVHDPHDERIVHHRGPARRLLARLIAAVRS
jgi:hypothetical protein